MIGTKKIGLLQNILSLQIAKISLKLICTFVLAALLIWGSNSDAVAETAVNQFVAIVNPVRVSTYTKNLDLNIKTQFGILEKNKLPATWLLTFDVLENPEVVKLLKTFPANQDFGIFLEVTQNFAQKTDVAYSPGSSWHFANKVFLSGYTQEDRKKFIDTVFSKFKSEFGYFPTSVGSWWTDSYSLNYMKEKYNITANLVCADQFSTDRYQIWGQPWMQPYYPSKLHAAIPAQDTSTKIDIVNMQWAARDPFNGYYNSLYSLQDYSVGPVAQGIDYFEKILNLYAFKNDNPFGFAVVGLESDLSPQSYEGEYSQRLDLISKLSKPHKINAVTMNEFSKWYRKKYPNLSPAGKFISDDLLGKSTKVYWYQSEYYRIGLSHDKTKNSTKIFDLRVYSKDTIEPYYSVPNRQFDLSVYIPSLFDEINYSSDVWNLEMGSFKNSFMQDEEMKLVFEKAEIEFKKDSLNIKTDENFSIPALVTESQSVKLAKSGSSLSLTFNSQNPSSNNTANYYDLSAETTHLLASKKFWLLTLAIMSVLAILLLITFMGRRSKKLKAIFLILLIFVVGGLFVWFRRSLVQYEINQSELYALWRLSVLPDGKVLVFDRECLQCEYVSQNKPAVFANKRGYVRKYGKHPIVYNKSVYLAKDQNEAAEEFKKTKAKFVYLVKYGDYIEKLPFSPGDLGVEKIFANAYAEIWKTIGNGSD